MLFICSFFNPQALSVSFGFPDCNLLKQESRGLLDNCDGCVKLVQKVNHRFVRLKGDLEAYSYKMIYSLSQTGF